MNTALLMDIGRIKTCVICDDLGCEFCPESSRDERKEDSRKDRMSEALYQRADKFGRGTLVEEVEVDSMDERDWTHEAEGAALERVQGQMHTAANPDDPLLNGLDITKPGWLAEYNRRIEAQGGATSMSNNDRTEALKLVVETRDWFRNEIEVGDEALVLWLRKLDKAIDLLLREV